MINKHSGCPTCYGTGEIVTDQGSLNCPDCFGDGQPPNLGSKLEWRLRLLEKTYAASKGDVFADFMWLANELRRAREALVLILARCQDADESDEAARYARTQAMVALGFYQQSAAARAPVKDECR